MLCTVVQWQVNQLWTSLECVQHVNNEYKCTLNFFNQSFSQLKVSSDERSHWWTLQYIVCWAAHKTLWSACFFKSSFNNPCMYRIDEHLYLFFECLFHLILQWVHSREDNNCSFVSCSQRIDPVITDLTFQLKNVEA